MSLDPFRERIVDTALLLAARRSWEALRLHDVAAELQVSLAEIHAHFSEKEDIVDAWFDRADRAMLAESQRLDVVGLESRTRLQRLMMTWLNALATYRQVTRQMIWNKLEPGHLHYQMSGLMRVSRTVQWWREAAQRDATLPRRALEESVLTGIYLTTFVRWMNDESESSANTAALLDKLLAGAERFERAFARETTV